LFGMLELFTLTPFLNQKDSIMADKKGRINTDKTIIINEQFLNYTRFGEAVEVNSPYVGKMVRAGKLDIKTRGKNKGKIDVLAEKNLEYIRYRALLLEKDVLILGKNPFEKPKRIGRPPNSALIKKQMAVGQEPAPKKEKIKKVSSTKSIDSKDLREDFENYIENLDVEGIVREEKIQSIRKTKAMADKAELELMEKRNLLFDRKIIEGYLGHIMKALFSKINNVPVANVEEIIAIVENDSDNARNRILDLMRDELVTVIEESIEEIDGFFKENPVKSRKQGQAAINKEKEEKNEGE
jgi:hypothetical protein